MIAFDDVRSGARFLGRLGRFLQHPVGLPEARAVLRDRLAHRERDFLSLMKHAVYERPQSPYRALLRLAGCEYGDLERLTHQDGVEDTLRALFAHGVHLTVDEFKGR